MTFRSLYRLERRGLLDCPIVGVAVDDWTTDDLRQHARKAIEDTGEPVDEQVFDRFARRLSYLLRRLRRPGHLRARRRRHRAGHQPGVLPGDPALPVRHGGQGPGRRRPHQGGARVVVEKPFGHDLASARALNDEVHALHRRVAALPDRPLPGQDGPGRDPVPPLRQRDAGAGLEPPPRGVRGDHHGGELRGRGPRPLLRPRGRAPGRGRQPHDAGGGGGGDGAAGRWRPRRLQGRHVRRLPGHAGRRPRPLRPRPVRRLPLDRGGGRRLDHRDLCRPAPGDRELALVGGAVLPPHRQVPAGHPDRAAAGLQATRPGWASGRRASSSRSRARW